MALSVGARRWAVVEGRAEEFLFMDQDEVQVRVLLHSGFQGGQTITLDGHEVKLVTVRAKSEKSGQAIKPTTITPLA